MPLIALRLALVLLVVIAPGIAAAADLPQQAPPTTAPAAYEPVAPDWIVTIGAEGRIIPAFPGAADKKLGWSALPLFSIRQAGTPPDFFGPRDSFSFSLINTAMFQFGPALQLVNRRKASDYAELYGLADVDYAAQVGAFANFWPVSWLRLRGEVRQGIGGETGITGDIFDFRRAAGDIANSRGDVALFQHHGGAGYHGECLTTGFGDVDGLQCRWRPLFVWCRHPAAIHLQPDMDRSRLRRISAADRLGRRFAAGDAARFAEPAHLRPRRHLFLQYAAAVVTFSAPRAAS
jgi:hypothetical protein